VGREAKLGGGEHGYPGGRVRESAQWTASQNEYLKLRKFLTQFNL